MMALYGSLEQLLQTLRDTPYSKDEISLNLVPESSQRKLKESLERVLKEKDSQKVFRLSFNYVGAISRCTVALPATLKGTEMIPWILQTCKEKKVASFMIIVKPEEMPKRAAKLYLFVAY